MVLVTLTLTLMLNYSAHLKMKLVKHFYKDFYKAGYPLERNHTTRPGT
jgi:hypothetical protein